MARITIGRVLSSVTDSVAVPLPAGASTSAIQVTQQTTLDALNAKVPASPAAEHTTAASPSSARLSDGAAFYDGTKTGQLPAALVSARLDVNLGAAGAGTKGQKTNANGIGVTLSSEQEAILASVQTSTSNTDTNTSQTAALLTGGTQRTKITDGTNNAAVKAASTAPIATDPALVVSISPNSAAAAIAGTVTANIGSSGALALEATLAAASAKLPPSLGSKTTAQSLSVTMSSDGFPLATEDTLALVLSNLGALATEATLVDVLASNSDVATEATLAALNAKVPAAPAAEHTTAASPSSARLSDGAAFYDAAKTGQLPTALISARLDVNLGAAGAGVKGQKSSALGMGVTLSTEHETLLVQIRDELDTIVNNVALNATLTGGTQRTKLTDGTNNAAVKAASTAPIATDPALVVSISPNSASITASNPSVGTDGAAIPASSTLLGASDGANLQQLLVESAAQRNLRISVFNAGTEAAVKAASTAALATDPALVVAISPNNTPVLPTGASTEATLAAASAKLPASLGAKTAANSLSVTQASDAKGQALATPTYAIGATEMIPFQHDEQDFTYNADGSVNTIIAKLAAGAALCTVTFTYVNGVCSKWIRT